MGFNPRQLRGPNGRWIRMGAAPIKVVDKFPARPSRRGSGWKGLKRNTVPYVRVNKRSQTVGVNAGTMIPGTNKRVVVGSYARYEQAGGKTKVDVMQGRAYDKVFGKKSQKTRRRKYADAVKDSVRLNPTVRAIVGPAQVRLGTSRHAGTTVIVRRGPHKTPQSKSKKGVIKYNDRMRAIRVSNRSYKKTRAQRRKKAAKRRKRK